MKKNRMLISALSLILVMVLIAGCGGNNKNNVSGTPTNSGATTTKKIKLTLWGGVPPEAGPQAVVDAWNAENPNVQVEYVRFVNDDAGNLKLDTALLAGQDADIYMNYTLSRLQKRIDAGVAVDMSAKTDYNIDEQMGPEAKQWMINDKYYGMPTKKNMAFIWLNKDMLDAAGLPIPPLDWTWSDLQDYALKLKQPNVWGLLQHDAAFTTQFDGTIGGDGYVKADGTSNFDNAYWKQGFEILHNMMFKDKSTPEYGEQLTSKMPVDTMFLKGETAMLTAGEFIFRNANNLVDFPHDFKIAFAPIPRISKDQTNFKYPGGLGDVISVNAKSKNQEAAWEFVKWYADGGMLPMAPGGRIPSSKSVDSTEAIDLLLKGYEENYDRDSLNKVVFGKFESFQLNVPQQVIDARKEEYEKYFLNKQDIDTTLKNMAERHNEFIKK
ncbi:ABC transporter substrate-binding protein [Paenibacillus sp. FSL A5-0031]|uniref:ABC transporter substrate-binding protein n=1 Tax=Paenibacillus sp. FSL A5-0031 TaxID=1920420 RepID=UPI00096E480B|nr:extracellular solute-binding protein [Paenibacillus sp. FSL A5-0031]OME87321.1 ABC transporter substrate-binding protein [Paenibacillus sp. FSL A5-0031]